MKIVVLSTGTDLEAKVGQHFGRCPYFIIADVKEEKVINYKVLENENTEARQGAGIQVSERLANIGINIVLTSNIGPHAFHVLSSSSIKIYSGASGSVKEAVEQYLSGQLREISKPTSRTGKGQRSKNKD